MAKQRPDEERKLYVSLNDDELRLKGDKQSRLVKDIEDLARLQALATKEAKRLKDKGEELSQVVGIMADDILNKRELQPVTCRWERGTEHWVCHRVDTDEVVDTAPITMADRQEELRLS